MSLVRAKLHCAAWRAGSARGRLARIAPRLVATALPQVDPNAWRTEAVTLTGTFVGVALVTCAPTGQRVVVKVPYTGDGVESLRRQTTVLAALHANPQLAGWLDMVPRTLAEGKVNGRAYWIEKALPGSPVSAVRSGERVGHILEAATRFIEDLHGRTAEPRILDAETVRSWVERPVRRIAASCGTSRRERCLPSLDRLRGELTAALVGRRARTSWIHGDFWPGNVLAQGSVVSGVVDWDRASPDQLALHDLLHLHVLTRRLATGDELGDVVVRALRYGIDGTIGLPAGRLATWLEGIPERPAVLLYWLRHVSLFIDSEGHGDNPRWLRGNLDRVLAGI